MHCVHAGVFPNGHCQHAAGYFLMGTVCMLGYFLMHFLMGTVCMLGYFLMGTACMCPLGNGHCQHAFPNGHCVHAEVFPNGHCVHAEIFPNGHCPCWGIS